MAYRSGVGRDAKLSASPESLLVPAAHELPSNAAYLAHLDVAAADRELIRLASNENTEPPSPMVREALASAYEDANLSRMIADALREMDEELAEKLMRL